MSATGFYGLHGNQRDTILDYMEENKNLKKELELSRRNVLKRKEKEDQLVEEIKRMQADRDMSVNRMSDEIRTLNKEGEIRKLELKKANEAVFYARRFNSKTYEVAMNALKHDREQNNVHDSYFVLRRGLNEIRSILG